MRKNVFNVILLAKIKKSKVPESYRFLTEFSIDPGYIFGDLSCFFCLLFRHRFSHRFFFDFGWIWGFPGRLVRPRCRPGSATSDPGGHPDGRDRGSRGRSGWPRVTPGVAFGRPVLQHHDFLCFSMALGLHCSCFSMNLIQAFT